MKEERYISILQKQLSGTLTPEEESSLEEWLSQSPDNRRTKVELERAWEISGGFSEEIDLDPDADFEKLERRIAAAEQKTPAKVVPLRPMRRWLSLAAGLLVLLAATFVWKKYLPSEVPMGHFATGELAADAPVSLADGSKVWLNKKSELRYFTTDDGKERRVELSGEAFFEVAPNPQKPFIVNTDLGEVAVLGTSFNVLNRSGSPTLEVAVSTGRVRLQPHGGQENIVLTANETGVFDQNKNSLRKMPGAGNNAAVWHTGKLVFDNTTLAEVLRQLSALHQVKISTDNEALNQCSLTVTFDKDTSLETTLETLRTLFGANLEKVAEKEWKLTGGRCG